MKLQQLDAGHAGAILEFETRNRAFFAASVPDRGDEFFADYPTRHAALLARQDAGTDLFHVLLTDDGTIAGRVNLIEIGNREAELGYRIGQDFTGRGVATRAVDQACHLARTKGLTRLRATVPSDNRASRAVLLRNGFNVTGATTVDGRPAQDFRRVL